MKRIQLRRTLRGAEHDFVMGYHVGDVLAVYKDTDHNWTVMHVPTGRSLIHGLLYYREAVSYALKIRTIPFFDWASTTVGAFQLPNPTLPNVASLIHSVGLGTRSAEELCTMLMKHEIKEATNARH